MSDDLKNIDSLKDVNSGGKQKKKNEIQSLDELITYIYSRKGKTVTIKQKTINKIQSTYKLDENHLIELALSDILLTAPRQLLLLSRDIIGYPLLKGAVRTFAGNAMKLHPVFNNNELKAVINNLPEAYVAETSLHFLSKLDYSKLQITNKGKPLKKSELNILKSNACYCLALWFVETRGLPVDQITELMYATLWKPKENLYRDETARLHILTSIMDIQGIGMACRNFEVKLNESIKHLEMTQNKMQELIARQDCLEELIEKNNQEIDRVQKEIADLQNIIDETNNKYKTQIAHLRDDMSSQRGRILNRLRKEVDLLETGLHALRKDTPKVNVMIDHADRALEGLRMEIKQIESEG